MFRAKFAVTLFGVLAAAAADAGRSPQADAELVKACERPDPRMVEQALKDGADPNTVGGWREAPALQLALLSSSAEAVQLLEKAGADSTRKSKDGSTALHAAASVFVSSYGQSGEDATTNLALVLKKGIPVREKDGAGREALELAADGSPGLVRMLLENGAVASPVVLAVAMGDADREIVDLLMASGADPAAMGPKGNSMLHALAGGTYEPEKKDQRLSLLELVAAKGVALEGRNEEGRTPLLEAARAHQLTALAWLLDRGADAGAVDADGNNALMLVCGQEGGYQGVIQNTIRLLIQAGCPLDTVNREGQGLLEMPEKSGNWETFATLMQSGIPARDAGAKLSKALLAWRERPSAPAAMRHIVRLLLPAVPELGNFSVEGRPLIQELVFLGDPFLLEQALKTGAGVDVPDKEGRTALMWASAFLAEEMKGMLLKAGADPTRRDQSGKTAADWAGLAEGTWTGPGKTGEAPLAVVDEPDVFGAIASGKADLLKMLLTEKPERLAQTKFGLTALQWAALHGQVAASAVLLKAGAGRNESGTEGQSPWSLAALANQAEWCRWFLQEAGEVERAALVDAAGKPREEEMTLAMAGIMLDFGWKPGKLRIDNILERNLDGSDPGKVRLRLEDLAGSSANPTDPFQGKPADPFAPEKYTSRPAAGATEAAEDLEKLLWHAVVRQETGVLRFCFEGGIRVKPGSGLLLRAAYSGNVEVARLLLAHGADLHETNEEGNQAAHQAAREGRRDLMDLLIREGARLAVKNKEGRTALDEAREAGYVEWADEWERKPAAE